MVPGFDPPSRPTDQDDAPAPRSHLMSLIVTEVLVLSAAGALTVFGEFISTQASILTAPEHSLSAVSVALAGLLLLAYPLWPGALLGRGAPLDRFGPWLGLRAAEVGLLMAVAAPLLIAATVFSHQPGWRVAEVLIGLVGVAAAAVAYRLVHETCRDGFRAVAVADAMLFLFGPLVVGYLLLEFYGVRLGWCWLISPLALATDLASVGLTWVNALVGIAGYAAVSVAGVLLVLPFARWCREEALRRVRRQARI